MKLRNWWMITLLAALLPVAAQAQSSLAALVSEASAEWMFGQWEAKTDKGDSIALNVTWDLEKHVVVMHAKMPDTEFKGYTVLEPGTSEPRYISYDTKGAVTRGTWNQESGEVVLRLEGWDSSRGSWKMAAVFGGNATDGLQVRLHEIDSSGSLVTPARATHKFKAKK